MTSKTAVPAAELHCHIEGTVTPAKARLLARRHGIDLSRLFDADGNYIWSTFLEFLASYDAMTEAVRTPDDYHDITLDYYRRAAADGVIYGEVFVSHVHPARFGVSYPAFVDGLAAALVEAEAAYGIAGRLILTGVRNYGVESVEETARLALAHPHPMVTGFGMAGDEGFGRPADYARAFDIAREAGLALTVHAGEAEGPDSVRAALDALKPARIGHGVRAAEDPGLVRRLANEGVVLEVCPASNLAIGFYASRQDHPLRSLYNQGVLVTLNSDDPAFFGASVRDEYDAAAAYHGFDAAALRALTRAAVTAAFCDPATKGALLAKIIETDPD